jgi:hypothetical protein
MKKIILSVIVLSVLLSCVNAQDTLLTSKRGKPILPAAGDWAIGIDATPFFQIFNSSSDVGFNFIRDNIIIGKKFIKHNLAHRAKIRLAFTSFSDDEYVIQDEQIVPDPTITVTDTKLTNFTNITVGYGLEKRTGYGRLQILYGAEILIAYESYDVSYTYGNSFSMSNPDPTSHNFGQNIPEPGKRVTFYEQGFTLTGALRAFLGVEYFFAPKISIGGEFGWGVAYTNAGDGKQKVQSWDAINNDVKYETFKTGGDSGVSFDNDNFGGAIYLMFHFK